jgi:hypothetical protein
VVVAFATAAARKYRKRVLGVSRRALSVLLAHNRATCGSWRPQWRVPCRCARAAACSTARRSPSSAAAPSRGRCRRPPGATTRPGSPAPRRGRQRGARQPRCRSARARQQEPRSPPAGHHPQRSGAQAQAAGDRVAAGGESTRLRCFCPRRSRCGARVAAAVVTQTPGVALEALAEALGRDASRRRPAISRPRQPRPGGVGAASRPNCHGGDPRADDARHRRRVARRSRFSPGSARRGCHHHLSVRRRPDTRPRGSRPHLLSRPTGRGWPTWPEARTIEGLLDVEVVHNLSRSPLYLKGPRLSRAAPEPWPSLGFFRRPRRIC